MAYDFYNVNIKENLVYCSEKKEEYIEVKSENKENNNENNLLNDLLIFLFMLNMHRSLDIIML